MTDPAFRSITFPIRSDRFTQTVRITETVASVRSEFQQIDILDCEAFGRVLLLDGHIQLSSLDEHAYHEGLVQVPMLSLKEPKRALIVGGGDGGALREIRRHPSIERVDMVEIDSMVVEVCQRHLPELSAGAFDDRRVVLHIQDAFEYVKRDLEPYDLVVVDSTDVYEDEEGELSERLFTQPFYRDVKRLLSPNGIVVTQSDNVVFCPYSEREVLALFKGVFERVGAYFALVPSFGGFSGFVWGSRGASLAPALDADAANRLGLAYLTPETYALGMAPVPFTAGS